MTYTKSRQDIVTGKEFNSGRARAFTFRGIPAAYVDKTDIRITQGSIDVQHHSLAEACAGKKGTERTYWCARCKVGRHLECNGRRHAKDGARGYAPCSCSKCMERRAEAVKNGVTK